MVTCHDWIPLLRGDRPGSVVGHGLYDPGEMFPSQEVAQIPFNRGGLARPFGRGEVRVFIACTQAWTAAMAAVWTAISSPKR